MEGCGSQERQLANCTSVSIGLREIGQGNHQMELGYLQAAYFEGQDIGGRVAECVLGGGCLGLEHIEQVKNASPYDVN